MSEVKQPAVGDWVEIECVILRPEERSPAVPPETKATPLVMRVNGFLQAETAVGAEAMVLTRAGRLLRGTLRGAAPPYCHTFGEPVPELVRIGPLLRAMLAEAGDLPARADQADPVRGGGHGR